MRGLLPFGNVRRTEFVDDLLNRGVWWHHDMRAPSAIATQVGDSPVSEISVEELPENLLLKPRLGGASVCEFDWLSHGPIVRGAGRSE
jgi:hypothetical protein